MVRLILLAVPLGLLVLYFLITGFKYTRMIGNIFMGLVYRPPEEPAWSNSGERFTVLDSSDQEIEVLYAGPKDAGRIVIFCHESGSTKQSWERYAHFLPRLGYGVLSVDFAKADFSQWPSWENVERVITVLRWARRAFSADVRVALFGVSNGADIALAASSREPSVQGVVADGLFSMKEIFRDYIRRWAPILVRPNLFGERLPEWIVHLFADLGFWYSQKKSGKHFVDIESLLGRKRAPLLLIYGESDEYVPASHRVRLEGLKAAAGSERLIVRQAGHNEAALVEPENYQRRIAEFLEKIFG